MKKIIKRPCPFEQKQQAIISIKNIMISINSGFRVSTPVGGSGLYLSQNRCQGCCVPPKAACALDIWSGLRPFMVPWLYFLEKTEKKRQIKDRVFKRVSLSLKTYKLQNHIHNGIPNLQQRPCTSLVNTEKHTRL